MITITTLRRAPTFAQGLVRDLRVRWALEEAQLPYQVKLIGASDLASGDYRARHPFGQVPLFEEDGFVLFESGSIVLHLGARSEVLLPRDEAGRARAVSWAFAALNTLEIVAQQLAQIDLTFADQEWGKARRPWVEERVKLRLAQLGAWLGDREYLEDRFTAGDLLMVSVLRILRHTDLVEREPRVAAYKARCETRPAFVCALRDQMAVFEPH